MNTGNSESGNAVTYASTGVDTAEALTSSLGSLLAKTNATFAYQQEYPPVLPNGYFANIVKVAPGLGVAISTDGVGTKLLVAELAERYDTVGIDLIGMNANDVICVGARPIALVDYIAVQGLNPEFLSQIGEGLRRGSELASISIPAGEIAQVPDMIRGVNEGSAFDLVGTCIGVVSLDKVITGADVRPGDVVIGIASSGLHSNGYTLARKVLLHGATPDEQRRQLSEKPLAGRGGESADMTLADMMLEPTRIYVRETMALLDAGIKVRAIAHITGDGFLNLNRIEAEGIGFVFDDLPEAPPIFGLVSERGGVSDAEMYTVFNMGIGLCVVVPAAEAERALKTLEDAGAAGVMLLGRAVSDSRKRIWLEPKNLIGEDKSFADNSGPHKAEAPK